MRSSNPTLKKNLILSNVGITLQTAGAVCIFAAMLGMGKGIKQQIKSAIAEELIKQGIPE